MPFFGRRWSNVQVALASEYCSRHLAVDFVVEGEVAGLEREDGGVTLQL